MALIPVSALALFFLWNAINGGQSPQEALAVEHVPAKTLTSPKPLRDVSPKAETPAPSAESALPRVHRAQHGEIVLIIDDLGFDGQALDRVMSLDPNVNCAILPNGTRVESFANTLHAHGFEILCHLPMEPRGHESPGRNAILTSMADEEIARLTRENVAAVPFAQGVNNHMGSRATTDRRVMTTVIHSLPAGMYFIDSRTTRGSVAGSIAHELNVPTAARNVFLDDVMAERAVRAQVAELAREAAAHGVAIGIGHPHPVTLRVLADELPRLRERGFRFVRASDVVR